MLVAENLRDRRYMRGSNEEILILFLPAVYTSFHVCTHPSRTKRVLPAVLLCLTWRVQRKQSGSNYAGERESSDNDGADDKETQAVRDNRRATKHGVRR